MIWKDNGFTLLEVMIALSILLWALLALLSMVTVSMRFNAYSNDYIMANHLIIDKAEEMRRLGYGNIGYDSSTDTTTDPKTNLSFIRIWDVTSDPFVPDLLETVTITVIWQRSRDIRQHNIRTSFSIGREV